MNEDIVVRNLRRIAEQSFRTVTTLIKFLVKVCGDILSVGLFTLAVCTIVRIPSMYYVIRYPGSWHTNRPASGMFAVVGLFNLVVFIIDIPFMLMAIPQLICFWRIILLYREHGPIRFDRNWFGYEGWELRRLTFKHFCLLMSDLFFLPFLGCLHVSWRGPLFQERLRSATNEVEWKLLVFKEFFALLTDVITFPVIVLLMMTWRRNSVRRDLVAELRQREQNLTLSRYQITSLPDLQLVILFTKVPVQYSIVAQFGIATNQLRCMVINLVLLPLVLLLLISWRHSIAKHILSPWYRYFVALDMSNERDPIYFDESQIRKQIFRNSFKLVGELFFCPLLLLCVCSWRILTIKNKLSECFSSTFVGPNSNETSLEVSERQISHAKSSILLVSRILVKDVFLVVSIYFSIICAPLAPHRFHSNVYNVVRYRKELIQGEQAPYTEVFCETLQIFVDIPLLLMVIFITLTIWRFPFLISCLTKNVSNIEKRKREDFYRRTIAEEFAKLLADMIIAPVLLVVFLTVWRIKPVVTMIKSNYDRERIFEGTNWVYPLRRITGDPIRREIVKSFFSLLLVDAPCFVLLLANVVCLIRLPALIGGLAMCNNFYSEYPIILVTETMKLTVDLVFIALGVILAILRPVGIVFCILEDNEHQRYRELLEYTTVIAKMLNRREELLKELEERLSIIVKSESFKKDGKLGKFLLANTVKNYLVDFMYLRAKLLDADLDDGYIHLLSRYIFLQDKEFHYFYRRFLVERIYLRSSSFALRNRNSELCNREYSVYLNSLEETVHNLKTFEMEEPPYWRERIGFFNRGREENQKLLIKNLSSGYMATLILVILNCLPLYRGITLLIAIYKEPYLIRKKAINNLKEYYLDFRCFVQVLFILTSLYRAPQFLSEVSTEIFCKGNIVTLRHIISRYPANIKADIVALITSVFKWESVAYVIATVLFLVFIPLSAITRVIKNFELSSSRSLMISLTSYALLILSPIGIAYSSSAIQDQLTEFFGFIICLLLVFTIILSKSRRNTVIGTIDYSRFDWQLIQIIGSEVIQALQIIYLTLYHTNADISSLSLVFLDSRNPVTNLSRLSRLCYVWFLVSSAPVILEGILTYVPQGTFTRKHLSWHAFISFFNANLFLVIPHLGLSYLSREPISNYDGVWCLYFILWFLITAILFYNQFFVPAPKALCYDPIYVSVINVLKLIMVVFPVLLTIPVPAVQVLHLATNILLLVCTATISPVSNSEALKLWRWISLFSTTSVSVLALLSVLAPTIIIKSILHILIYLIMGAAGIGMLVASYFVRKPSLNESARSEFLSAIRDLETKAKDGKYLTVGWKRVRPSWIRLMKVVRAANMTEKREEGIRELFQSENTEDTNSDTAPPGYSQTSLLDKLPSYDEIIVKTSSGSSIKPGFVPDIDFLITPIGEWQPYSATAFTDNHIYLEEISLNMKHDIIIDDVCSGSYVLLLLEKYIHYKSLSKPCVSNLENWRKHVYNADWNGLNKYLKMLSRATGGNFLVQDSSSRYALDDMLHTNPDVSVFPEFVSSDTILSLKLEVHKTERLKWLSFLPHPWCLILELLFPPTYPAIKSISQQTDGFILDLFKETAIRVNSVNPENGIGLAIGAEIVFPKKVHMKSIDESRITFSAPFPIGKKSFFSVEVKILTFFSDINKIGISDDSSLSIHLDKIIGTLEDLSYS